MAKVRSTTEFEPVPSFQRLASAGFEVVERASGEVTALGVPVERDAAPPASIELSQAALQAAGFDGSVGSTLVIPREKAPVIVVVGIGEAASLNAARLRDAAAAFARAVPSHERLAFVLPSSHLQAPEAAARSVVEGVYLARYRYDALRREPKGKSVTALELVAPESRQQAQTGARLGRILASSTELARDLANTPHSHLTATRLADLAQAMGPRVGLEVEVFGKPELQEMGCGGLLGVNAGSSEPPRMIILRYKPKSTPSRGRLAFIGKGVMYDSGGLSLKPGTEVHAQMKNDMAGAAAVFAAMTALDAADCASEVTAYLMCTDNMPSGTAMALGDVITIRGGKTVEVINTDAEGRLIMADALVLAREQGAEALVDVATLTGDCLNALGTHLAGVMGNHQGFVQQVCAAARETDEPVWPLPLERAYRSQLDSDVADLRNLGGKHGGAITAGLFLSEFVGDTPWAHLDMASVAQSTGDSGWQTAGCTGFGARLLVQLAANFERPQVDAC